MHNSHTGGSRYFNPRSDERSDKDRAPEGLEQSISIHAPTNGATIISNNTSHLFIDFNPRSDERSDVDEMVNGYEYYNFNPHSDERSDSYDHEKAYNINNISIHAPTNGATQIYNPASCSLVFQSTLRRTERRYFTSASVVSPLISIHAPTNGATSPCIV